MKYLSRTFLFLSSLFPLLQAKNEIPNISQIIVLMLENRSFDHMLGYLEGVDGVPKDQRIPIDPAFPSLGSLPVTSQSNDIATDDPLHDYHSTKLQINNGKMDGFVKTQLMSGHNLTNPISMFHYETAPIIHTLAKEYAVFDAWHASFPGPTDPNRAFAMSGTSRGTCTNFNGTLYPQQSYIDYLNQNGHSAGGYYQTNLWFLGYFEDLVNKPSNAAKIKELDEYFYEDLANGVLPEFTWLQPSISVQGKMPAWQHPDASVMEGERLLKKIYEAVRKSPKWDETVFIVTYDEHGGFYDHVPPPHFVPPPDDYSCFDCKEKYNFDSLGIRIPTIVVSPYISKGTVVSKGDGIMPADNSAFDSTSLMATVNDLLKIPESIPPLGNRMKWASKFTHLFYDSKGLRKDCIETLPELPPPPHIKEVVKQRGKEINEHLFASMLFFCKQNYDHEFTENELCPAARHKDRNQGSASDWILEEQEKYFRQRQMLFDFETKQSLRRSF